MTRSLPVLILLLLLCRSGAGGAQPAGSEPLVLKFAALLNGRPIIFVNEESPSSDSLRVTTLRCYISGISLWQDGKAVWEEPRSYHLLDASAPERMRVALTVPSELRYSSISFLLGVDSTTSCSGALGGDLDPALGMYWAWQSGYINFKLEGTSPACPARKHRFQFHLGGYMQPFAAIRPVRLEVKPGPEIRIAIDPGSLLSGIDLSRQHTVMIPGAEAAELSDRAARIFYTRP